MDSFKAFDTFHRMILIKKPDHYGVKGRNLLWSKSYLNNLRQFLTYDNSNSYVLANVSYAVPQWSIIGPLVFLLYLNDPPNTGSLMYADDTNSFCSNNDIETIFFHNK